MVPVRNEGSEQENSVEHVRAPEDFDVSKEIYIVGVPIDLENEKLSVVEEFGNILVRAKSDNWPVLITSTPAYYHTLGLAGWKLVEDLSVPVTDVSGLWHEDGRRSASSVYEWISDLAVNSDVPIVFLRPGSPCIGDAPANGLIKRFRSSAEVMDTKSGPDIVGDLAEKTLGIENTPRKHLAGTEVLGLGSSEGLSGKLVLIRSLDSTYKDGDTKYFKAVVDKLISLGLGDKTLYIKGPRTQGESLSVNDLQKRATEYPPSNHYTIALLF
jgi:hypothetical protein